MTPQKATLYSMRTGTLSWFVSSRRLSPQFQLLSVCCYSRYLSQFVHWPWRLRRVQGHAQRIPVRNEKAVGTLQPAGRSPRLLPGFRFDRLRLCGWQLQKKAHQVTWHWEDSEAVLRIRDILARIRIPGSVPLALTNGSGLESGSDSESGSRSCYFRRWPSRWQLQNLYFLDFLHIIFWSCIYIIFQRQKA